jgi:hypothetical protein
MFAQNGVHDLAHILHAGSAKGLDGRNDGLLQFCGGEGRGEIGAQNEVLALLDFSQIDPTRGSELVNGFLTLLDLLGHDVENFIVGQLPPEFDLLVFDGCLEHSQDSHLISLLRLESGQIVLFNAFRKTHYIT